MTKKPDQTRISITWQEPAMLQIGKAGVSDGTIKEIDRLLKQHKYLKIRILKTAMDSGLTKEQLLDEICKRSGAHLVGIRGNTAVVYRLKGKET